MLHGSNARDFQYVAFVDLGVDQPAIAAQHPTLDCAFYISQRLIQDQAAIASRMVGEVSEGIFFGMRLVGKVPSYCASLCQDI